MNEYLVGLFSHLSSDINGLNFILLLFISFAGGFLASLTPCSYPLVPITAGLFGAVNTRWKYVISYVSGICFTFSALGLIVSKTTIIFGSWAGSWLLFLILGNLMLFSTLIVLDVFSINWLTNISQKYKKLNKTKGSIGFFIFGATSGLVASPCTTPILAGILAVASLNSNSFIIFTMMFFYSLGFSILITGLAVGIIRAKSLPKSGNWLNAIKMASALILLFLGQYFIFKAGELY